MNRTQYEIRTDFADEWKIQEEDESFIHRIQEEDDLRLHLISVIEEKNILGKAVGDYMTIVFSDMNDRSKREQISDKICFCLREMMSNMQLYPKKYLVVGLGNHAVSSDALGPAVAGKILVTAHLYQTNEFDMEGTGEVACIVPGVMGKTGIESSHIVKSIVESYQPDLVIVVDALATSSTSRINRVIQINNVGISPGSGVGNHRLSLAASTLGRPVIALGVATVISLGAIIKEYVPDFDINQIQDKTMLDLVVTPKAIDSEIEDLTAIFALALNRFLHPNYDIL